jgi:hypothetical protein
MGHRGAGAGGASRWLTPCGGGGGGGGAAASSTSPWLTPSPTAFRAPAAWSPGVKGGAGWTWHLFSMISVSGKFTAAARGDQRFAGFWSRRAEVLDRQGLPRAPFRVRHPRHVSSDRPRGHSHDGVDPLAVHGAFAVAFDSPVPGQPGSSGRAMAPGRRHRVDGEAGVRRSSRVKAAGLARSRHGATGRSAPAAAQGSEARPPGSASARCWPERCRPAWSPGQPLRPA